MPEFNIIAEYIPSSNLTAQFIPVNFNVPPVLTSKTITANGLYEASADNATGYSSVTVAVPDRPTHNGELNVTPTTEAQTIDVPSYLDGYGPVNVAAVTSSIDANIQPENIVQGVSILGTEGSVYVPTKYIEFAKNGTQLYRVAKQIDLTGVDSLGDYALYGVYTKCYFPANTQDVVTNLTGYSATTPFGATSGTVLFDLPSSYMLTGVNEVIYERNPKYDTQTALAWRIQDTGDLPTITIDWTPFYTSGTTDPQVGATIYSDAACTTAVTTISTIA